MITNIKDKLVKHKLVLNNISYLTILQIITLVLPLITYPYLIRVLGGEKYGLIVFAQSIIFYLTIITNFGFNISAVKEVSVNRDDNNKINEIVSSILIIKSFLFLINIIILILLIILINQIKEEYLLFILTLSYSFYELIFPVWFFQGIEKMKYVTLLSLISKIIFTVLIFILIHKKSDYIYVPVINGIGSIISGIIALYIVFIKEGVSFIWQKKSILKYYFYESFPFFLSRISATIIDRSNLVLIGAFIGMQEVSFYDLAYKIINLLKIPYNIINQAIYPRIAVSKNMSIIKKIISFNIITSLLIYFVVILLLGNKIVYLLGGSNMEGALPILYFLGVTVVTASITYFLGNTVLVVMGYYKPFNMSTILSTILYIILIGLLYITNYMGLYQITIVVVVISFFDVFYRFYYIKKYKLI